MRKKSLKAILAIGALLLLMPLTGCKTTVKNYQDAYDVARQKRERDEERHRQLREEMGVDTSRLESADDSQTGYVELRDSEGSAPLRVKTIRVPFHRVDKVGACSLVVAKFSMPTNADSLAADLQAEGFAGARSVRSGDDFYVVVAEGAYPADFSEDALRFRRLLPDFPYPGLGEMVIAYRR